MVKNNKITKKYLMFISCEYIKYVKYIYIILFLSLFILNFSVQ